MKGRISATAEALPVGGERGTVGVLGLRSYMLAGNAAHYDGVIEALEARGLRVIPAFASGLDSRPAIEEFFMEDGRPVIDALVSLTGLQRRPRGGGDAGEARRPLHSGPSGGIADA
jgi:magnesium chelatase subunit H